ncbi:AraC family transcriptional regulator [Paenibacillus sp. CC-CFT747]|nr:AraC family transcriptional regulator [Paenibacillus sp. CC-CFT747]
MNKEYGAIIEDSVDYIESRLAEELTLGELARRACFSEFHFHRVFQALTGEPVMEYVRKRRLATAACRIAYTRDKLIDIALDSGFRSQETFIRAFKKLFHLTPGDYRRRGFQPPLYPKAEVAKALSGLGLQTKRYQQALQGSRPYIPSYLGGIQMNFKMITKPAFQLIGYELRTTSEDGRNHREIPAFWQSYLQNGDGCRIPNRVHKDSPVELGVCTDFDLETGQFSYLIGMEAEHLQDIPEGLVGREFPAAQYAVFTTPPVVHGQFPSSIQSTWGAIFSEWFPHSGYEHAGGVEFELYDERCHQDKHERLQMDIYIPVREARVPAAKGPQG